MVAPKCLLPAALVGTLVSCKPAEEGRPSLLESPRILAIQASPPEVKPGAEVKLDVLRAGPDGRVDVNGVELDFCVRRKPIAAPGVVAEACLEPGPNDALLPIAATDPVTANIPQDACAVFGPKPPAPEPNQPEQRPADPDTTGGYYQPLRALDGVDQSIAFVRLQCGLAATTQENSIEFGKNYLANGNPLIEQLYWARASGTAEILAEGVPVQAAPGERLQFAATWVHCADNERCTGAESYLVLDSATNQLRRLRESIRVGWYVTAGTLDRDRSGRSADEDAVDAQNSWLAPSLPGTYWLFAVIRDDRGGVGWTSRQLQVSP